MAGGLGCLLLLMYFRSCPRSDEVAVYALHRSLIAGFVAGCSHYSSTEDAFLVIVYKFPLLNV